jgi:hypothetical protein
MAESTISVMYGNALGLSNAPKSTKYQMLLNYTDPNYVTSVHDGLGDLSLVVQTVVATTKTSHPSTYTIGQINQALDVLSSLPAKAKQMKSNHDWKQQQQQQQPQQSSSSSPNPKKSISKKPKNISIKELRIQWLRQLNDGTFRGSSTNNNNNNNNNNSNSNPPTAMDGMNHGLSPLEHKWLVRILLRKMQFGLVRVLCVCVYVVGMPLLYISMYMYAIFTKKNHHISLLYHVQRVGRKL